ncbi:hypothetical protein ABIB85_004760 [Bradyrhizobium sp. JR1.5]
MAAGPQSWFKLSNELELSNELKRVSSSTGLLES